MQLTILHLLLILLVIVIFMGVGFRFLPNITESFIFNNGAGCMENKCKLNKDKISPNDYKEWCNNCPNCMWDSDQQDCVPNGKTILPKDDTTSSSTPTRTDDPYLDDLAKGRGYDWAEHSHPQGTPNSGNNQAQDSCGNNVSMTSLLGLSGVSSTDTSTMSPFLQNIQDMVHKEFSDHTKDNASTTDSMVPISDIQGLAALKANDANTLQDIQKIVHNELLSQKGMTTGAQMAFLGQKKDRRRDRRHRREEEEEEDEEEEDDSPSNHQGHEFKRDCAKNTCTRNSCNVPDMSKYIRKDSIPCWGCTLPQ